MRPSSDVLDCFYGLSDLDNEKRTSSVAAVLEKATKDENVAEYCIERLIGGISSARAATRIGYSAALTLLLNKYHSKWPISKIVQLAEKKMDLSDKERANANAIGQYLICTVLINCTAYEEDYQIITERLCHLYRQFAFLACSIGYTIAEMAASMDAKKFKKLVFPRIKDYLETSLNTPLPEFLIVAFLNRDKHAAALSEVVSFITKNGVCKFDQAHYANLILAMKKCDAASVKFFTEQILSAGKQGNQFIDVYCRVIEKWAATGDESKVLERIFKTAELSLQYATSHKEILAVFSPVMISKISSVVLGKQGPQQRMLKAKISSFCEIFTQKLVDSIDNDVTLLEVMESFDKIGNFEALTLGLVTPPLIEKMNKTTVSKWVETVTTDAGIRRIIAPFPKWGAEAQLAVLLNLIARPASEDLLYTIANCVDSLFMIKVRPGELINATFSEDSETILQQVVELFNGAETKKIVKKLKKYPLARPLTILWLCLKLWEKITIDADAKQFYVDSASEIIEIAEASEKMNNTVLVDLLISLLGQTSKFHRSVVYFAFAQMLPVIKKDDISHIIDTLMLSDNELSGKSKDEDDDMEDEDMEENIPSEEEAMSDSESEAEENAPVDPKLVSRLKEAMGEEKDDESDASLSDMDDDAMFAMDEKLAAAFKSMVPSSQKKQALVNMQTFRNKVTDFLLFAVSSTETPIKVKMDMIAPLLRLAKLQLKRSSDGPCAKKTIELLEMIAKLKKVKLSESQVVKLLGKIVEASTDISNPALIKSTGALTSFLFASCMEDGSVPDSVKSAYVQLFSDFVTQDEGKINGEVATATIYKYPVIFESEAPKLVELAFDEQYRIFRRTETLLCINTIVKASEASAKSNIKSLAKKCGKYLETSVQAPAEIKPRFFGSVLKVMHTLSTKKEDTVQEVLSKSILPIIEPLVSNDALWKTDMKKCNSACQQICGKAPLHVLRAILKSLD